MRYIEYDKIVQTVADLCEKACYELPADVLQAIENAVKTETNPRAVNFLKQLVENANIAKNERIPICQDTGLAVLFVDQGADLAIKTEDSNLTIINALNDGVKLGYEKSLLRKSVVLEPLENRSNTQTNTPAVIHYTVVPGDKLKISMYVTVQKEMALRMAAAVGNEHYGVLGISLAAFGDVEILHKLPASVFWPQPQVESAMVKFVYDKNKATLIKDYELFKEIVSLFMGHRRKTLKACTKFAQKKLRQIRSWEAIFEKAELNPQARPEEVSPEEYIKLEKLIRQSFI